MKNKILFVGIPFKKKAHNFIINFNLNLNDF